MLAQTYTESEFVGDKALLLGRTKVHDKSCFCPNSTCLADELVVRTATSYADVWLVTDEEIGSSWLMKATKPSCPHCGSTLVTAQRDYAEVILPLM
ncbi:MAG: hypothetical protein KF832_05845 [Caldilineaceae bacterium]|nr:hypothetical protein [Caldilineaceae bacterium]